MMMDDLVSYNVSTLQISNVPNQQLVGSSDVMKPVSAGIKRSVKRESHENRESHEIDTATGPF